MEKNKFSSLYQTTYTKYHFHCRSKYVDLVTKRRSYRLYKKVYDLRLGKDFLNRAQKKTKLINLNLLKYNYVIEETP